MTTPEQLAKHILKDKLTEILGQLAAEQEKTHQLREALKAGIGLVCDVLDDINRLPETAPRIAPQTITELDDWQSDTSVVLRLARGE